MDNNEEGQTYLEMSDEDIINNGMTPELHIEEQDDDSGAGAGGEATEQTENTEESTEETNTPTTPLDYEAEYKRIMSPFKANGKEVQVSNIEEAITLMQMGANYNKKMSTLKPSMRIIKLLEQNQLLDEEKLSYLIDLDKKDPTAISKLVQDSGIDPLDIDTEKAKDYQPNMHRISDSQIELDEAIENIKDSPSYAKTIDIVGNKWDTQSKRFVAENPQLLGVINDHVDRGIYDVIFDEVDRQKMLGNLTGLSDLEAYRQVGDAIQAQGGFNHLGSSHGTKPPQQQVVAPPKPRKEEDPKLRNRRLAAAAPNSAAARSSPNMSTRSALSLSDEEFSKLSPKFV